MEITGQILPFESQADFEQWLDKYHNKEDSLWIQIFKKASGKKTITYAEAVESSLCYGWIDGIGKTYDAESYVQRFTPRRVRSVWSKINTARAEELIKKGRMKPSGLAEIERAKADGRWDAAYEPPSKAQLPTDFQALLKKHAEAQVFYDTLNSANTYAIIYRLHHVKPDARDKKYAEMIEKLEKGEKFHP